MAGDATAASDVVILTDANFEHLTQASTGSTTGSWFVEFYAPWCGHCQNLQPEWEKLASQLKGIVNVAKVDATVNGKTARRFGINAYPTLKLITGGKVYTHSGSREAEDLAQWVRSGYKETSGTEVPQERGMVDGLQKDLTDLLKNVQKVFEAKPEVFIVIFALGSVVGLTLSMMIYCLIPIGTSDDPLSPKAPAPKASAGKSASKPGKSPTRAPVSSGKSVKAE